MLVDLTAAVATAAWKIANVVLGKCKLTHAGPNLQRFGNLGDGAGPLSASNSGPVTNGRNANSEVATTQRCGLKKTRIKSKKETFKPILERINAPGCQMNGIRSCSRPLPGSSSACPSPTTCSTPVVATWTSARDATSTSSMLSSSSTTPSSSNLASLIYSNFILNDLRLNSNLELYLQMNRFCKFYYPQLILFLDNALSAQPHLYKSFDSVISSSLRFLGF